MKRKKMNVLQLTIITIINMMGSGIIMLPANLSQVGSMSILSWIVTAGGAMCLAYGFSRAGMYSNKEAGMGGYTEYSFGKSGSFMTNYVYGISLVIANVAMAVSMIGYMAAVFNVHLTPVQITLGTIITLWIATLLNFGGSEITGKFSSITILGVIIPVVLISIVGWFYFNPQLYITNWNPHHYGFFNGVSKSISITLWAFLGLESASADADSVDDPKKNVPIAVLTATAVVAVLYIVSTSVIQGIAPDFNIAHSNAPFGYVFTQIFNPVVGKTMMILMIISCFGSLVGWQFTIADVFKVSAREGYFPKVFGKLNRADTPIAGMVIITIVQTILSLMTISPSLSKQFTILINLAVVTNVIPYILVMASLPAMQYLEWIPEKSRKFTNFIAFLAAIYSFYAIYASGVVAIAGGAMVAFFGWIIYGFLDYQLNIFHKN